MNDRHQRRAHGGRRVHILRSSGQVHRRCAAWRPVGAYSVLSLTSCSRYPLVPPLSFAGRPQGSPHRRQVKDCRNWPRPASRATARVAPTIHGPGGAIHRRGGMPLVVALACTSLLYKTLAIATVGRDLVYDATI